MAGYTKLFSSLVTSSIWCVDSATLRVWIAMLAVKDGDGYVEGSIPGFANLARVSLEEMRRAVEILSSPDPDSRTSVLEGRRIIQVPGGWQVVNHDLYRNKGQSQDGSRAPYMRKYRAQKKAAADV
jgi:hypothetical protein